jgi:preprotein translocase SecE subunit
LVDKEVPRLDSLGEELVARMPSVKDENPMATNVVASGAEEPEDDEPSQPDSSGGPARSKPSAPRSGFFTIYKSGQGYWTRMGTAAAAALLALLTMGFIYQQLPVALTPMFTPSDIDKVPVSQRGDAVTHAATMARNTSLAICVAFLIGFSLLTFILMNKPTNADFMIATDSEMKKVNWTSRKELIGSTKVVIGFMFLIAFLLFGLDVVFGYFFKMITVLKAGPFG